MSEVDEVIEKAAALIEERGWCQGDFEIDGKLCVLGGVHEILFGDPHMRFSLVSHPKKETRELVYDEICNRLGIDRTIRCGVSEWNDAAGRTKEEVISRLRGEPCR